MFLSNVYLQFFPDLSIYGVVIFIADRQNNPLIGVEKVV